MAFSVAVDPVVVKTYSGTGSMTYTFSSANVAVGDLLVAHTSNGSSSTASDFVRNASNVNWSNGLVYNGRRIHWKTATAADIDAAHTYVPGTGTANGWIVMAFKNARVNTTLTGVQAGTTTSLGTAALPSYAVKIFYNSGVTFGNFPYTNYADGSNLVEWKFIGKGSTISTFSSTAANWHSTNNPNWYAHIVVEDTDTKPVVNITSPATGTTFKPSEPLTINWTYTDADNDPMTSWAVYRRSVGTMSGAFFGELEVGAGTSKTYPAGTFNHGVTYEFYVSVDNANGDANSQTITLTADDFTYPPEVISSTESGVIDITSWERGETYEIQVATADAEGFGSWSDGTTFVYNIVPTAVILNNPITFTETEGSVQWDYTDADNDPLTTYHIRYRKRL